MFFFIFNRIIFIIIFRCVLLWVRARTERSICRCASVFYYMCNVGAYPHTLISSNSVVCNREREKSVTKEQQHQASSIIARARALTHTHKIVVVLLIDFSYALGYSWSAASAKLLMHTRLRRAFFVSWIKSHLRCFLDVCSHTIYGLFTTPL